MKKNTRRSNQPISRTKYPAVFEDSDDDSIPDPDDPHPRTPGDKHSIEEVRLSDEIEALIDIRDDFTAVTDDVKDDLQRIGGRKGKVYGRVKTPYSIINKLRRRKLKELTDVAGTMLVVEDKAALDKAAQLIEQRFEIIDRDDFYTTPNAGYRALHYIVMRDGKPVEVQLKTQRMKKIAEASHTAYKRGRLDATAMEDVSALAARADAGDAAAAREIDPLLNNQDELTRRLTSGPRTANEARLMRKLVRS